MGAPSGVQAALQKGLLPLLLQKLKMNPSLLQMGGKPGMPLPQRGGGQSDIIPGSMGGKPLGGPSEQFPEGSGAGPQAGVTPNPNARVGNMGAPVEQPIADVRSLEQLLVGWHSRKQQKQHAEAANAATALMQAIEGAKQSNDWTPVQDILHENEKLFNKVYKGWLQKAESQKKASQSQGKADPDTQGFEAGVQKYMEGKQQQPQGGPPKTMGGYYLPQASPGQALGQQEQMAELQAREKDPGRALQDKLTSGESREAQLGAGPEKTRAEKEKAEAMIKTSAQNLQRAMAEAKKAEAELQVKQIEAQTAKEKGAVSLGIERKRLAKTQLDLDIARQKLQLQMLKNKAGAISPAASAKLKERIGASDNVIQYLDSIKNQNGFTAENITYLQGLLKQAGAVGLSGQLPKSWFGRWTSNKEDIASMRDAIKDYRSNLSSTIKEAGVKDEADADTEGDDDNEEGGVSAAEPQDGDEVPHAGYIYKYSAKDGRYNKTDKKAPNE